MALRVTDGVAAHSSISSTASCHPDHLHIDREVFVFAREGESCLSRAETTVVKFGRRGGTPHGELRTLGAYAVRI